MRNQEFLYWLMGPFEIANLSTLTIGQLHIIRSHLKLVWEVEKEFSSFNMWLTGVLDAFEASGIMDVDPKTEIEPRVVAMIKSRLSEVFIHVVDKSYGGDVEKQQELHDTYKRDLSGPSSPSC